MIIVISPAKALDYETPVSVSTHTQPDFLDDSAALIEASDLDWTILRPGWFVRGGPASCSLTRKGEPFVGHDVSIDALSKLIVDLAMRKGLHVGENLGVSTS